MYDVVVELPLETPDWHDAAIVVTNILGEIGVVTGELLATPLFAEHPCGIACIVADHILELLPTVFAVLKHSMWSRST